MSIFSFLRIKKNAQRRNPPQGYVDLVYNPATGQLAVREADGSVDPLGGSSGPVQGVTDGSNAASGVVGEYLREYEAGPVVGSDETNLVALELPAGDWDVVGKVSYGGIAVEGVSSIEMVVTSSLSGLDATSDGYVSRTTTIGSQAFSLVSGPVRFSLIELTTVYLRVESGATASSQGFGNGVLRARRVR